ncbi:formyltetrahydrofolate deformylase [Erythrobacter sp. QSSC1-22B]|uniref:formyltetrahydrofolate deformylase n=1 Tax=Erythrobacter sp. QSSC1-22B TaxID=1860125 RepID=UPI0008049F09|nr:formyltetrahydrofolate deformylase [Erythrobacter sp. QSSC1-22B]OBX20858.1 formyltetrahydrofolate deformylase [Erythrobacter sp. QSSC1-22B]
MNNSPAPSTYILTLSCEDRVGIVAAVTGHLAQLGGFILDSQQYADLEAERFFLRVEFKDTREADTERLGDLRAGFVAIARQFDLSWELLASSHRPKLLIAVSKGSHCLNDLLHRWQTDNLPVDVVGVVSNHPDLRRLAEWHGVAYHHLPVSAENREEQEQKLMALFNESGAELLVLARYMQVLSPALIEKMAGRCINIHHSFLPSFKGARPYHRAHQRGVKLIGATAHFVTSELDEGPIIEQDVERVDHRCTEQDLIRLGRDIEARVLARAVRWAAERRVFLNGARTLVFR